MPTVPTSAELSGLAKVLDLDLDAVVDRQERWRLVVKAATKASDITLLKLSKSHPNSWQKLQAKGVKLSGKAAPAKKSGTLTAAKPAPPKKAAKAVVKPQPKKAIPRPKTGKPASTAVANTTTRRDPFAAFDADPLEMSAEDLASSQNEVWEWFRKGAQADGIAWWKIGRELLKQRNCPQIPKNKWQDYLRTTYKGRSLASLQTAMHLAKDFPDEKEVARVVSIGIGKLRQIYLLPDAKTALVEGTLQDPYTKESVDLYDPKVTVAQVEATKRGVRKFLDAQGALDPSRPTSAGGRKFRFWAAIKTRSVNLLDRDFLRIVEAFDHEENGRMTEAQVKEAIPFVVNLRQLLEMLEAKCFPGKRKK